MRTGIDAGSVGVRSTRPTPERVGVRSSLFTKRLLRQCGRESAPRMRCESCIVTASFKPLKQGSRLNAIRPTPRSQRGTSERGGWPRARGMAARRGETMGFDGGSTRSCRILGACNPPLAYRALVAEPDVSLLLPCNVVVREEADGGVVVGLMDPVAIPQMTSNPEVSRVAEEVRLRVEEVRAALVARPEDNVKTWRWQATARDHAQSARSSWQLDPRHGLDRLFPAGSQIHPERTP